MMYLDYNATTPLCDEAREAMLLYLDRHFGNPSSVHAAGREARAAIDDARDKLAALLRVKPHELISLFSVLRDARRHAVVTSSQIKPNIMRSSMRSNIWKSAKISK